MFYISSLTCHIISVIEDLIEQKLIFYLFLSDGWGLCFQACNSASWLRKCHAITLIWIFFTLKLTLNECWLFGVCFHRNGRSPMEKPICIITSVSVMSLTFHWPKQVKWLIPSWGRKVYIAFHETMADMWIILVQGSDSCGHLTHFCLNQLQRILLHTCSNITDLKEVHSIADIIL